MAKIVGMTDGKDFVFCSKCGIVLYNDHGWILDDGTAICKNGEWCSRRVTKKKEEEAIANGTYVKPRWRR